MNVGDFIFFKERLFTVLFIIKYFVVLNFDISKTLAMLFLIDNLMMLPKQFGDEWPKLREILNSFIVFEKNRYKGF